MRLLGFVTYKVWLAAVHNIRVLLHELLRSEVHIPNIRAPFANTVVRVDDEVVGERPPAEGNFAKEFPSTVVVTLYCLDSNSPSSSIKTPYSFPR